MSRLPNVFRNLVHDEDSTTELLCNLMQYSEFRRPFLSAILSEKSAFGVEPDDIDTQVDLRGNGRADLVIDSDTVYAIIEVKVGRRCELTGNQPDGYFNHLLSIQRTERSLVFLVPADWTSRAYLEEKLESLRERCPSGQIRIEIVDWDRVLAVIKDNGLADVNPIFANFHKLLQAWFRALPVDFSFAEVQMLYTKELPEALSKIKRLIDDIQLRGSRMYKITQTCTRSLPPEYGITFQNPKGEHVLWFGVWPEFWMETGIPLCFGVDAKWGPGINNAFRQAHTGKVEQYQNGRWTLGYIPREVLQRGSKAVDEVWKQLEPVLNAVMVAEVCNPGIT